METEKSENVEVGKTTIVKSSMQFDYKKLLGFLGQPLDSLKLSANDFIYGIVGLASSYVGFLIWSLLVTKKLSALFNPFYELANLFNGGSKGSAFFAMYSKLILSGLWSTVVLLGVVYLVGWWRGGSQVDLKSFVARMGGLHVIGCAGFLLAAILSASFSFSILIVAITLLTLLVLTLYAGAEVCKVPSDKLSLYFLVSVAGYVLLCSFLPQFLF